MSDRSQIISKPVIWIPKNIKKKQKYINIGHTYGYVAMVTEILFHFWFPRSPNTAAETRQIMSNIILFLIMTSLFNVSSEKNIGRTDDDIMYHILYCESMSLKCDREH